jgi:cell division transport system ATP-binding protein
VLELVGLTERAGARADQLSGGERQRAAIARAIASQPKILLADEPTGNLDPATTVGIMRLLDRIAQDGTTVLVSTHDRAVVDALRRQVIAISDGRVVRSENNGAYAGTTR